MKKVKVKVPAKINLTLDVTGRQNGYHTLDSLFLSVSVYDEITLTKRKDRAIRLTFIGSHERNTERTNAYRAAEEFIKRFETNGADITIKRNIPSGGGLGSSSADPAGVIAGLAKLYGKSGDLSVIANAVGSDVAFMLDGGFARVRGRGNEIQKLVLNEKWYFLILSGTSGVSATKCYARYDEKNEKFAPCTEKALDALKRGDKEGLFGLLKNDLYCAAKDLSPEIGENLEKLKEKGFAAMTGSGSACFAVFSDKRARNRAYKALKEEYRERAIKAESVLGIVLKQ